MEIATVKAKHWSRVLAEELIADHGNSTTFTCASGITPSGHVHVGNLRDVLTIAFVGQYLRQLGVQVRLLHSWDDFDRFRKVPAGVPDSFSEFIGRPVTKVPDPEDKFPSFAARFASEFENSVQELDIDISFKSQTLMYESGIYGPAILEAVGKRREIFDIINSFRTQPLPEAKRSSYLPIEIYCRRCTRDGTEIELVDEEKGVVRYQCHKCHISEELSILTAGNIKLPWKIDWPMRWRHEEVVFEPGGKDHGTAGGSYFVASEISRKIFGFSPPRFQAYEFIGLKGVAGKMSSSAGTIVTPGEALRVYQGVVLKWLFAKVPPLRAFDLPLDQQLSQIYDDYDKSVLAAHSDPHGLDAETMALCGSLPAKEELVSFRTISSLVALLDGNHAAVHGALTKLRFSISPFVDERISKADFWLNEYLPEQRFRLLNSPNCELISTLSDEEKLWVRQLTEWIRSRQSITEAEAQAVFNIPVHPNETADQKKVSQRRFFRCVYGLLFGRDNGPRLPTLLTAIPSDRYLPLLDAALQ
jgi:lysyl-tRNA synthetase class 1